MVSKFFPSSLPVCLTWGERGKREKRSVARKVGEILYLGKKGGPLRFTEEQICKPTFDINVRKREIPELKEKGQ